MPGQQASDASAPAAGENGARPANQHHEPSTPLAGESAEAGAGDPAPHEARDEGAVQRPPTSKPGRRRGEYNKAP